MRGEWEEPGDSRAVRRRGGALPAGRLDRGTRAAPAGFEAAVVAEDPFLGAEVFPVLAFGTEESLSVCTKKQRQKEEDEIMQRERKELERDREDGRLSPLFS